MSLASRLTAAVDQARQVLDDPDALGPAIDRIIGIAAPGWAQSRMQSRHHTQALLTAYEGATPNRLRKYYRGGQDGDSLARVAALPLREQARHLERNHDLARSALRDLADFTIGAQGILIEPQPRMAGGDREIHNELADQISELWHEWCRAPDVTGEYSFAYAQRLAFKSGVRDGDVFTQHLAGFIPSLDHRTRVPYSIELLEADMVPSDYSDSARRIVDGIERNNWGRAVAYHVYLRHPGDAHSVITPRAGAAGVTKRVAAERMVHYKCVDRIHQHRGVSLFASVLTRLADAKDYEESERVAAKVAASMAAYIRKGGPEAGMAESGAFNVPTGEDGQAYARSLKFAPGMVFDDLLPGEDIGVIDSKRPNSGLGEFIAEMSRRVAGGFGVGYSSMTRRYEGSYSSQRQELVEQWMRYAVLAEHFAGQYVRPIYERFIATALLAGRISVPAGVDITTVDDALYRQQAMPWIDPLKEAAGWELLEKAGLESGPEAIRRRGGNPREVLRTEAWWRERARQRGLEFSTFGEGAAPPDRATDPTEGAINE